MATKTLSRVDIRRHLDRAGVVTLKYAGRLTFTSQLYGFDPGVFFVVTPSEVPVPDEVEQAAATAGMIAADHPDMPMFRRSVVNALVAEATLVAPELLAELTDTPTRWLDADRHDLERRHRDALVSLQAAVHCMANDLRRRALLMRRQPLPLTPVMPAARDVFGGTVAAMRAAGEDVDALLVRAADNLSRLRGVELPQPRVWPADDVIEADLETPLVTEAELEAVEVIAASSTVIARVTEAVKKAREIELHQRLPGGARRHLAKLPAGVYIIAGESYEPRADLASAMTDAQDKRRNESTIVDWDGEYPVVVRRYGTSGRVVYRVETALRRAASEAA